MCLISERAEIRRNISMMRVMEKIKIEQEKAKKKKARLPRRVK